MTSQAEREWPVEQVRAEFPGCQEQIYVDVASRCLLATRVRDAIQAHLDDVEHHGATKEWWFEVVEHARGRLAGLIGARTGEIAFTKNTSEGLNIIANGLAWRPGDSVVVGGESEHPNNLYTWLNLRRLGVDVRIVPTRAGCPDLDALVRAMDHRTRACAISWVSFQPGARADLARLAAHCRERDVLLVVDGAQAVGVLDVDVGRIGIDALAGPTSKGLLGLYGMGFLYCGERWCERLQPAYLSRFAVDVGGEQEEVMGAADFTLAAGARRFEIGNFNYVGAFALDAALGLLAEVGTAAIERSVLAASTRLVEALRARGLPVLIVDRQHLSHIVCVGDWRPGHYDASPQMWRLHQILDAEGVRLTVRRGTLRFSFHLWNTLQEVDRIVEILDRNAASWA